ncbi:MAG: hypothetical protein IID39_10560 [Planctomycetes bacterium]|nr:hypothetical protein [Planctomycetota bacterium]
MIAILALLMTVLITVASSVMTRAKVRQTKAIMQNLELAIDQFHTEAPLKRVKDYRDRYGDYPCDELEGFHSADGIPGPGTFIGPGAPASDLNIPAGAVLYQPIKAMALVMRLYSPEATAILDGISPRYRLPPANAGEFFDRDDSGGLDTDDEPLIYFVDAWGTPFDYFATLIPAVLNNPTAREGASIVFNAANRGRPLLVSYGPDGPDQFSQEFINTEGDSDLVSDHAADDPTRGVINHRLNADNVYIDDSIKGRLAQGP